MKLRKITIDDKVFLWTRRHYHSEQYEHSPCHEKLSVYLEGKKKSPLVLTFKADDNLLIYQEIKWIMGDEDGVIWSSRGEGADGSLREVNLNKPSAVAAIIRYFLENGWKPAEDQRPFEPRQALQYLDWIAAF